LTPVPFGKTLDHPFAVLPDAFDQVAGDADIQRSIQAARQDIYVARLVHAMLRIRGVAWLMKFASAFLTFLKKP
jgi:hypothetical protein